MAQVSSGGLGVQTDPTPGDPWFESYRYIENFQKNFYFRTTWLRSLKFGMWHCQWVLYQVSSNEGPRVYNGPSPRGTGFELQKYIKILKNLLLQSRYAQMLEI